jgi:hypothetical protein
MRRVLLVLTATAALTLAPALAAHADPAFGPGNGQQVGDRCHPPGLTVETPGCK